MTAGGRAQPDLRRRSERGFGGEVRRTPETIDTIAAIATAVGGGVGIVRLSGSRAEAITRALVPSLPRSVPSHRLFLGEARDPQTGGPLDEVLAVVMRAPRSYTGEDVAELHGHGGAACMQALLDAALSAGARLATPGEFTRRAFVAGRIDLTQAEAVSLLISAADRRALRAARVLRSGALGERVGQARQTLVAALAEIEGAIDFPDEAAVDAGPRATTGQLEALAAALSALAASYRRPIGVVPEVLLVGCVNAGKSSLLNLLAGKERALVDAAPGTTRDVVEAEVDLDDLGRLRLVDTAGLREGPSALEVRGQAIADARRADAALALVIFDGSAGWSPIDEALVRSLEEDGVPVLLVENKVDLPRSERAPDRPTIRISARTGSGLVELTRSLLGALSLDAEPTLPVASARQASALREAAAGIERAVPLLAETPEVAAVELRRALHQLGLVTGETVDEDVLDALFARFCIGK